MAKLHFHQILFQSLGSHDPSAIIVWFASHISYHYPCWKAAVTLCSPQTFIRVHQMINNRHSCTYTRLLYEPIMQSNELHFHIWQTSSTPLLLHEICRNTQPRIITFIHYKFTITDGVWISMVLTGKATNHLYLS